jgi:zinc transport system substrate-binding protein
MIKKLLLTTILGATGFLYANVNAVVSVLPQKTFVEAIGGDKVDVALMVKPGSSPHTYEPKPSQMKDINNADIYFSIGVEFEHSWLPKFVSLNKKMQIGDMAKGIEKMAMGKHSHGEDKHEEDEHEEDAKHDEHNQHDEHKNHNEEHADHDHQKEDHDKHADHDDEYDSTDPHLWTSPANVKIIAKNIYENLVNLDMKNKDYYKKNYEKFIEHVNKTDKTIKRILLDTPTGTKFMVFHPAWGYFARDYGLTQVAIEAGGKNPKPKQVAYLIDEAKEEKVKAVFTAPEFSDKVATQIAKEVGIPVIKVSPLNPKWSENLLNLANAIANK